MSGISRAGIDLPTTLYSPNFFKFNAFISSSLKVRSIVVVLKISEYVLEAPETLSVTVELLAEHCAAGTPIIFAPASTNAILAEAPILELRSNVQFTDHEPPVIIKPHFSAVSG